MKLLKLPEATDELPVKLTRLERQLAQAREGRDTANATKRQLERQLTREITQCKRQLEALGESASKDARAACGCQSTAGVPEVVVVEPSSETAEPAPLLYAVQLVASIWRVIRESPTAGIPREYIDAFFKRYHRHLARVVETRLPPQTSREA